MNEHKYPKNLKDIKARRSIRDTAMPGSKSQPSSPLTCKRPVSENTGMQRKQTRSVLKSTEYSTQNPNNSRNRKQSVYDNSSEQSEEDSEGSDIVNPKSEDVLYNKEYIHESTQPLSPEQKKKGNGEQLKSESERKSHAHPARQNSQSFKSVITLMSMVFAAIVVFMWFGKIPLEKRIIEVILPVKVDFPTQDENFWSAIISGLTNVLENDLDRTTVFLFLNSNSQSKGGRKTINNLSAKIAKIAAEELGSNQPIVLSKADILSLPKENGYFIYKYRSELEKQKVLLIHDLNEIPADVAQSFHYFCDSETPIVKKSVIIFTMDIPELSTGTSLLQVVEDTLQRIWSPPLKDNVIHPLITRLTTNVVAVTPELIYLG